MKKINLLVLLLFSLLSVTQLYAGGKSTIGLVNQKPVIDGVVDDLYSSGIKFSSFKQIEPEIFADPSYKSEIYFIYDAENIYIAGKLYQPSETIKSSSGRKDASIITEGDYVTIAIDPMNNGNSAYYFQINPSNGIADGVLDNMGTWDTKWDGVFSSATKVEKDYWSFEFQMPLTTFSFQNKDSQTWGIMFLRNIAQHQERISNNLIDKNHPYRINDFTRIEGLSGLKREENISFVPFTYYSYDYDKVKPLSENKFKAGGEIRYNPKSSLTLIATLRPDYAQIETDKEIINVTDVPSSYPEKRPFFTESSDLYQGQAVNTRNIQDIDLGIKLRHVVDNLKYDLTWVLDQQKNKWYMGDARWTDNETYHLELISGLKQQKTRNDYNVTGTLGTWLFDKRLIASTKYGTINRPGGAKNEWESENSAKWETRELRASFYNHIQTKFYNPNVVGFNTLSNETENTYSVDYSFIKESGFFRTLNPGAVLDNFSVTANPGNSFNFLYLYLDAVLNLGDNLGNWKTCTLYRAGTNNNFRYRQFGSDTKGKTVFEDAFSKFILITQNRDAVLLKLSTDYSKAFGMSLYYDNYEVRKSKVDNMSVELYWKITGSANLSYSLENIRLYGSEYQSKYYQMLHRFKLEYNLSDRINFAGVFQLNNTSEYKETKVDNVTPVVNITAAWEYMRGSFVYLVYNNHKRVEKINEQNYNAVPEENQSFAIKINKQLSF